jgi:hypothetical protein
MTEMTLFKGNALVNPDLFKSLMEMNKTMAGSAGAGKRISIRGGKFRMMVDGQQVAMKKDGTLNLVVVNAAAVSRQYYGGAFDPDNPSAPDCWSLDTNAPAPEVPEESRQSARCADCKMNIKGSGQGDSRACRFSQRLAVVLEGELDKVYQLAVPAASLFGEANGKDMPLQAYIKFLSAHNTPAIGVVTEARFDDDSDAPKLFFSAVRPLEEDELRTVLEARDSEDAKRAITFTVSQTDKVSKASKPAADEIPIEKPKTSRKAATRPKVEEPEEEGDEVDEPEVIESKPAPKAAGGDKLASILQGWDDE